MLPGAPDTQQSPDANWFGPGQQNSGVGPPVQQRCSCCPFTATERHFWVISGLGEMRRPSTSDRLWFDCPNPNRPRAAVLLARTAVAVAASSPCMGEITLPVAEDADDGSPFTWLKARGFPGCTCATTLPVGSRTS